MSQANPDMTTFAETIKKASDMELVALISDARAVGDEPTLKTAQLELQRRTRAPKPWYPMQQDPDLPAKYEEAQRQIAILRRALIVEIGDCFVNLWEIKAVRLGKTRREPGQELQDYALVVLTDGSFGERTVGVHGPDVDKLLTQLREHGVIVEGDPTTKRIQDLCVQLTEAREEIKRLKVSIELHEQSRELAIREALEPYMHGQDEWQKLRDSEESLQQENNALYRAIDDLERDAKKDDAK